MTKIGTAQSSTQSGLQGMRAVFAGRQPEVTPVWFMRQAGRSLPEYRELRAGVPMLDACLNPEMAAEITVQPVRRLGVDAGIFFSDIVVPLRLLGVDVEIVPGRGPVFASPIDDARGVASLVGREVTGVGDASGGAFSVITEAVQRAREMLATPGLNPETPDEPTPLLGFASAPFTLASYLVEGGPSKDHLKTRAFMLAQPAAWTALARWCAQVSLEFLRAQVLGGVIGVQVFDSWVGVLSRSQYRELVLPHTAAIFEGLSGAVTHDPAGFGAPLGTIHFGTGCHHLLQPMSQAGAALMGIDWRLDLSEAIESLPGVGVQGNIDPALVVAASTSAQGASALDEHVLGVLRAGRKSPVHILNLGHGVNPDTDPDVLAHIVRLAHRTRFEESR
ncbi:MAG: uroporphyrinogen decarboxylase [Actinomycetaceae bacterium]|nr:uroporphyrinogen decarboxylase [Actinomycetaceae bacterium]